MSYIEHPSHVLQNLFARKPWQGADPIEAKYIFVGLDANFALDVETQIPEIVLYLQDGPQFWINTEKHHPFVLDAYKGSGNLYHKNFELIKFSSAEAEQVSFVELIEVPTTGRNNLTVADLSLNHMNWLRDICDNGNSKYIFIPPAVVRLMKKKELFAWLRRGPIRIEGDFKVLRDSAEPEQVIYEMYHLSNYGRYDAKLMRQIVQLKGIVTSERNDI
jgi:hypothetical protein